MQATSRIPDLFAPDVARDPFPAYAALRRIGPVLDERNDMWVLTRHADVLDALHDPTGFSSAGGYSAFAGGRIGPPAAAARADGLGLERAFLSRVLIASDPPEHTVLRRVVSRGFTRRAIAAWEPRATTLASRLVEGMVGRLEVDGGADFTRDLAIPLPVTLIAEVLGIPAERMDDFRRWSEALVGAFSNDVDVARDGQALAEMVAYFAEVVDHRRRDPGDDMVSTIAGATPDGERLAPFEVVMFCVLLLVAGNETTTNLLGNLQHAFWDHPGEWDAVVDDPSLAPAAVEEGLRYCGPVQGLFRRTTAERRIGGVDIPEGAHVYVCFAAANRDETVFPDAERFVARREVTEQVAFGHGVHYCLGAHLARLEATQALRELARRRVRLRPGGEAVATASPVLRGYTSIPVALP